MNTLARDSLNEHGFAEEATLPDAELLPRRSFVSFVWFVWSLGGIWINDDHPLLSALTLLVQVWCVAPLLFDQSFLPSKRQCLKPVKPCWHVDGDVLVPYTMDSL